MVQLVESDVQKGAVCFRDAKFLWEELEALFRAKDCHRQTPAMSGSRMSLRKRNAPPWMISPPKSRFSWFTPGADQGRVSARMSGRL